MTKQIVLLLVLLCGVLSAQTTINGSRVILGDWNASGATGTRPDVVGTSLPATCTVGASYFKSDATAGHQSYRCVATNTWRPVAGLLSKSITIFDPVTGDSGRAQIYFPTAVTITRIACSVKAATSATINFEERAEATPDTAGTAVMASDLVCDTDSAAQTSFTNAGIATRVPLALTISAVSGTPNTLRVHIEYTVD